MPHSSRWPCSKSNSRCANIRSPWKRTLKWCAATAFSPHTRRWKQGTTAFLGISCARCWANTERTCCSTWASPQFQDLFDREIPEWRRDNAYMRYAVGIPVKDIKDAHCLAKAALIKEVHKRTGVQFDPSVFTIGFARRAATYKRADLLFKDIERLKAISQSAGPIQILYAGKAHPHDQGGKDLIRRVIQAAAGLSENIKIVYLENYNMALAK